MRGTSEASLNAVIARFTAVLTAAGTEARNPIGEQLLDLVPVVDGSGALSRALTDPNREPGPKAALVRSLLDGKADPRVVDVVADLSTQRWSREEDIADAIERLGVMGILRGAQRAGVLEEVEDQLFRVDRMLVGYRELRTVLGDTQLPSERRLAVARKLFKGLVRGTTMRLLEYAVANPRGRTLSTRLAELARVAARMRERLLAAVTSAVALTPEQIDRLGSILEAHYGNEVQLNVTVDPDILGGLRVQVADDVYDATMLGELRTLRRKMAV